MTFLKEKHEQNLKAAEILIEKNLYASSVHCAYYGCYQLMLYILKTVFSKDIDDIKTDKKSTHKCLHVFFQTDIKNIGIDAIKTNKFDNTILKIKGYRINADYDDIEINQDIAKKTLKYASDISKFLKETYTL